MSESFRESSVVAHLSLLFQFLHHNSLRILILWLRRVSFRRKKNKEEGKKDGAKSPTKEAKAPAKPPTLDDIPDLIDTMLNSKGEKSAAATKRVYELCDVGHKQNRVPMVCSGQWLLSFLKKYRK